MYTKSSNAISSLIGALVVVGVALYWLIQGDIISGISLVIWIVILLGLSLLIGGLRIINQYEGGVVLTLGRYTSTRSPGLIWIFPGIQRITKVDMRITTADIPEQDVITKDNVTVGINAVVYFHVKSAERAILEVQNFAQAVALYAQAALRDVVGGEELDLVLSERDKVSNDIRKIVDVATEPWGIDVLEIKLQDIHLPQDMKRAMAKQAEAERERRAVIINAEGEYTAADKLAQAAKRLSAVQGGISLRTLETIEKINPNPSKMVIFTLPTEFFEGMKAFTQSVKRGSKGS